MLNQTYPEFLFKMSKRTIIPIVTILPQQIEILAEYHFVVVWVVKMLSIVMSHGTLVTLLAGGQRVERAPVALALF